MLTIRTLRLGKPINLSVEAEEVAGFFGAMLETDHAKDATFCKNYFTDFKSVLARHPVRSSSLGYDVADY